MAIIKRSDAEAAPQQDAAGSIAVEEPAAQQPAPAPPPPAPEEAPKTIAETLPSALEPELRRIIDTAVARVAAIELEAIREAREITQRSEQEAREALKFALDRAFNLINTLELLAATVGGMAEALKIELDDAIEALRSVPQPESELAKELAPAAPAPETPAPAPEPEPEPPAAAEAPTPEPPAPAPEPEPEAAAPAPEPEVAIAEPEPPAPEPEPEPAPEPPAPEPVAERPTSYPPAERQAQSLAAEAPQAEEDEQQPATVVVAGPAENGRPAVPNRRRGLIRRLFTK